MQTVTMSKATVLALFVGVSIAACSPDAGAAKATPTLRFRPVLLEPTNVPPSPDSTTSDPSADAAVASCDPAAVAALASVATTMAAIDARDACVLLPDRHSATVRYYLGPAGLVGKAVHSAEVEFVTGTGWTIKIDFTRRGSEQWDALAEQQFHQQVAIVLDGEVLSAPTIQPADVSFTPFGGVAVVSGGAGGFKEREATKVAALIAIAR